MTPAPGIEPGTHWLEASARTTAPSLFPFRLQVGFLVNQTHFHFHVKGFGRLTRFEIEARRNSEMARCMLCKEKKNKNPRELETGQ